MIDVDILKITVEVNTYERSCQIHIITDSQNQELVRLEGTTGYHVIQLPCLSRITPEHTAPDHVQRILENLR